MDILAVFFDGWEGIIKIAIAAPVMYVAVVASIRIFGKRSTSQMNNFDWIVTVAIGSLTASGIILDSVTIIEALFAVVFLLAAQYLLTKKVIDSSRLTKLVKAKPALLVHDGKLIHDAMRRERITKPEIMATLREHGLISIEDAQWVILETDATFSVIAKDDRNFSRAKFEEVSGFPYKEN
ncbi:MAG: DUF421 domain-containing protein [Leptolyngbyaceae cyanobacterium]